MKLDFSFEALLRHQGFSKELFDKLSADVAHLEKTAAGSDTFNVLKSMIPNLGMALGVAALSGTLGYFHAKKKFDDRAEDLSNSYNTLLVTHKPFASKPDEFRQRFSELALISPTVATNPRLAQKVIEPRLSKGFDLDDVHRLAAIEHHTAGTPKVVEPLHAAEAKAWSALGEMGRMIYPLVATKALMNPIGKEVHTINRKVSPAQEKPTYKRPPAEFRAESAKMLGDLKKQSSGGSMEKEAKLLVSEECLGRMLADRYSMFKTAGILPKAVMSAGKATGAFASKAFSTSAGQLGKYIQMMAVPLMIGGGIQLLNQIRKQRDVQETMSHADQVFAQLKKTNENVRENLPVAQEAFDTLKSFAPALAAKPLVARTFVEHVISSEGRIPPDTTQMLANTQKMINQLNEATGGGFIEGLKSPMSLFKHNVTLSTEKKGKKES